MINYLSYVSLKVKTATDSRYTLTNGKLTIQNPDDRDSRYYRCEASNPQGKIISNYAQLAMGSKYTQITVLWGV